MTQPNTPQNKFTTNIFGDSYLPSINDKKFDEIAYSTYFDIEVLDQLSKEFTFYIFIGTDSGMMLKHLQLLNTDPSSVYLFIEDTEILQQLNNISPFLTKNKLNILFSTPEQWQEAAKASDIIKYIEVDRVEIIKSFSAKDQIHLPYLSMAQKIQDEVTQLKWTYPDKFQKKIYIQRKIENSADNFNPAIQLKGLLKGKPALILAGGPSLDNYINWIEDNQQYYVVIAVSRLARRLLSTKIIPDIFVTADPFESAFTTSKEVLAFGEKSILVYQAYSHPKIIGQWQGLHFYLGDLLPWDSDYQPENMTGIGPTVTNCAMHLAIQMGITDQILFGVDLCYSAEGHSHVSETIEHDRGIDLGFAGTQIVTNNNKKASTTYEWSEARNTISVLAKLVKASGGKVINPNPDAAKIEHVGYTPLVAIETTNDIIDGYQLITQQLAEIDKSNRLQHYSSVLDESNKQLKEVELVLFKTKKIVDVFEQIDQKDNDTNNLAVPVEIEKIINHLDKYSQLIKIVESLGINGFLDFIDPNQYKNKEALFNNTQRYYTSLYIACDIFSEELKSSILRLNIRIKEESESNNSEEIIKQWGEGKDQHYGRINLIQKRNLKLYNQIKSEVQKEFIENFEIQYSPPPIKETKTEEKQAIRLEGTERKLYDYFLKQDKVNLNFIIKQIEHFDNEESISLTHLSQGYIYELEQHNDQAINEYIQASTEQTLESGLKRILDITLKKGDIENTIACLQALSDISPEYLIQLANIYQISKLYKEALDTYSLYIDQNPEDILILIKMGLLYLSLDVKDGAEFVFKRILEIDKNNQTASVNLNLIHNSLYETVSKLPNKIKVQYSIVDTIDIDEYLFTEYLREKYLDPKDAWQLDPEKLAPLWKKGSIGFFVVNEENIKDIKLTNAIKKIHKQFKNSTIVIFYFNNTVKNKLAHIFQDLTPKIQLIKPNTLYDIINNIEIFVYYAPDLKHYSTVHEKVSENIFSLILKSCKNIFVTEFNPEFINETFVETSLRYCTSLKFYYPSIYAKVRNESSYLKDNYIQAMTYNSNSISHINIELSDITFYKKIELALEFKKIIHFNFNFRNSENWI